MPRYASTLARSRRLLRHFDQAALHHAPTQSRRVFYVFVFDSRILDILRRSDRHVEFLHGSVQELDT